MTSTYEHSLKSKNSYGYDEVATKILKINTPFIIFPICKKAITIVIMLSHIKCSVLNPPLYQKGDKQDVDNYRPILWLPSFSKVLEKLMFNWLLAHFNNNKFITSEQLGFPSNSSREKKLLLA